MSFEVLKQIQFHHFSGFDITNGYRQSRKYHLHFAAKEAEDWVRVKVRERKREAEFQR